MVAMTLVIIILFAQVINTIHKDITFIRNIMFHIALMNIGLGIRNMVALTLVTTKHFLLIDKMLLHHSPSSIQK
jgi:hypothetical protein